MRFQPVSGRLLAAASDKVVSLFDVETDMQTHSFQVWHLMLFVKCCQNFIYIVGLTLLHIFSCANHKIGFPPFFLILVSYQGHSSVINYLCWDLNGDYLASVCEESVKVWSLTSGECIHDFSSNGNQFHSCAFHPSYSALLVIGGMTVFI